VERNRKNRDKEKSSKERIPRRSYRSSSRQERDEDALNLSDELDAYMVSEFPGLKVGDGNLQAREEEEVVEHELGTFGKAKDPIFIYLNENISLTDPGRGSGDCQEDRERKAGCIERGV
jgi:hypothetical protein